MYSLLRKLKDNQILLEVVDGQLKVFANALPVNEALIDEIKEKKNELIRFLTSNDQNRFKASFTTHIPLAPEQDSYALSSSQYRLWILSQLESRNIAYNIPTVLELKGTLVKEAFAYAFAMLQQRHESLRTVFKENEQGEVRQYIHAPLPADNYIKQLDLRTAADRDNELKKYITGDLTTPFNLEAGPLLRVSLYQVKNDAYILTCVMHHIISDGWSMKVLVQELLSFYDAYCNNKHGLLPALTIQYKDYATWQQRLLQNDSYQVHKTYWLNRFAGDLPVLQIPADKERPVVKTYSGNTITATIPPALNNALKILCHEQGATLFTGLLVLVNALLYRYANQEDIIIGTPIAGREHIDLEPQIGFYVNTLALRTKIKGKESFRELLEKVRQTTFEAFEHQAYPFDELINELNMPRDLSRNPLFDVMVVLQNNSSAGVERWRAGTLEISEYAWNEYKSSKFDLSFTFVEANGALRVMIVYSEDIFSESTVTRLTGHLQQLLQAGLQSPSTAIDQLEILDDKEKEQLLTTFNNTSIAYPANKPLTTLFEEQVERTPGNAALAFNDTLLTYSTLNEHANQLAYYLRKEYNIQPDDLIGLQLERSEWMIVGLLGILKAGGAYVPIDTTYPQERIDYILTDCACKVVLNEQELTKFQSKQQQYSRENMPAVNKPDDLAYIIYTSGSTGTPKGVMIPHCAVVNLVTHQIKEFGIDEQENILQFSSLSFDASVEQIFIALTSGACLTIIDRATQSSPEKLEALIDHNRITHIHSVPAVLQLLPARKYASLKRVVAGGDTCSPTLAQKWSAHHTFYNKYGPTETTITSIELLYQSHHAGRSTLPIGRPVANTTVYILDSYNRIQPLGVTGEICIGGAGVARGYLNNPVGTKEKFIPDPYHTNRIIYKTGDRGRWLDDGNIEFAGRQDAQVKIRGYRIEPGEIESALQKHPQIESAVVIAHTDATGEKQLVAFWCGPTPLEAADVKNYLSGLLPSYMVPIFYVQLTDIPLNSNRKIDKRKLKELADFGTSSQSQYVAPRNEIEKELVTSWQEILGRERIGIKDNFFESGGHSLKATRLVSQIRKRFEIKINLQELFKLPVLEDQAAFITQAKKITYGIIHPAPPQPDHVLSSSQRRLWVLSQLEDGNIAYNMPSVHQFEGSLNYTALEYAFSTLISRHESLRTAFRENEQGEIRQVIISPDAVPFKIHNSDLRQADKADETLQQLVTATAIEPFDLYEGNLVRSSLYQVTDDRWIFVYVTHHIISDGWSTGVLIKELLQLYDAYCNGKNSPLAPLSIQYKDYANWQQGQIQVGALALDKAYWLEKFSGELPVLTMPADKPRPAVKTYAGKMLNRTIDAVLTKGLQAIGREQGATIFMSLLTTVYALLYRYTGQEDIIIGTPIAGREHTDLEDQIGFYVNTLALRAQLRGQYSYKQLLGNIRQLTLDAYTHQAYPFDELVDALDLQRDLSRHPLFDVMVVLQNNDVQSLQKQSIQGLQVSKYESWEYRGSKFDLLFNFAEEDDALQLHVIYNNDIYKESTVNQLLGHFEQLLKAITEQPATPIGALDYLTAAEKHRLLFGFNDTAVDHAKNKTVIDLFEKQVIKTPDYPALIFEERTYDYTSLNKLCNQLARYILKETNVAPEDCICVLLDRSEWSVISMIAIMKLGCTYVPVDKSLPASRIEYILKESGATVVIMEEQGQSIDGFYIIRPASVPSDIDASNLHYNISGNVSSYVIYTSGSTGEPKGVEQTYQTLYNLICWNMNGAGMRTGTKHLQFSSFGFDYSLNDVYYVLATGGTLYVINESLKSDLAALKDYVIAQKITTLPMPYAALKALFNEISPDLFEGHVINEIISTGEQLYISGGLRQFLKNNPSTTIHNVYGPSETHVVTGIAYSFSKGEVPEKSSIGKPIHNTVIYILDKAMQPVPVGVEGDIYIGGWNLAKGYKNRPDLTAEKFITDPFVAGATIYRSGDIGKWLPNGEIEYMLRKDNQVKINGYRIELEEIEKALRRIPKVKEAIVKTKEVDNGDKVLVAYVVSNEEISTNELRNGLKPILPAYMIPGYFISLEQLPLTANGKLNTRALPDIADGLLQTGVPYVAPRDAVESKLVELWSSILKIEQGKISVKDNFFSLGGHSLKATRLISQVHKQFDVRLSLKDLFIESTLEGIALEINSLLWVKNNEAVKREDADTETLVF